MEFAGADYDAIELPDLDRLHYVRSAHLIALCGDWTGLPRKRAAAVIDGFWEYVADVRGNYRLPELEAHMSPFDLRKIGKKLRPTKAYLVIPRFGTFHATHHEASNEWRLSFRSRTRDEREGRVEKRAPLPPGCGCLGALAKLFGATPSPEREPEPQPPPRERKGAGVAGPWMYGSEVDPAGLSVKRRIALRIARTHGLDLPGTARLLDAFLTTLILLFDRDDPYGPTINFPRRATFVPNLRTKPPGARYRLRPSPGLAARIVVP
jgi:hypothetical protein